MMPTSTTFINSVLKVLSAELRQKKKKKVIKGIQMGKKEENMSLFKMTLFPENHREAIINS